MLRNEICGNQMIGLAVNAKVGLHIQGLMIILRRPLLGSDEEDSESCKDMVISHRSEVEDP